MKNEILPRRKNIHIALANSLEVEDVSVLLDPGGGDGLGDDDNSALDLPPDEDLRMIMMIIVMIVMMIVTWAVLLPCLAAISLSCGSSSSVASPGWAQGRSGEPRGE